MHEIRATVPVERSAAVTRIALDAGICSVTIYAATVHGPERRERRKDIISVEASTPQAKAFVDALLSSPVFDAQECSITSRELRAIISDQPLSELTRPMTEPIPDVIEDLWQLTHVTPSYIGRAAGGAILLANGVIENSPIAIVIAALFLPFLSPLLAVSFGMWSGDRALMRKGILALLTSTALAVGGGAAVALLAGGPVRFSDFKGPFASFGISAVIGVVAGLCSADDAGRRYLVGVAAAVQFAIFPVWFGAVSVLGLPERTIVTERLLTFGINIVTIAAAAVLTYGSLRFHREEARRFVSLRR